MKYRAFGLVGLGAHPRSRGENCVSHFECLSVLGSSPLTRGKYNKQPRCYYARGLIPAHAGKMAASDPVITSCPAHPRSRGENVRLRSLIVSSSGSSPLTRGKCPGRSCRPCGTGLIPAHAGKIRPRGCTSLQRRAHPRSRGENPLAPGIAFAIWGSSPLTRGKCGVEPLLHERRGLIPAHAGKIRAILSSE